jgi:hypothetical protein
MSRYAEAHRQTAGPGDARPTALQIIRDEGLEGSMKDKVRDSFSPLVDGFLMRAGLPYYRLFFRHWY